MLGKFKVLWLLLLLVLPVAVSANHLPAPTGYVNDFAGVISAEQKQALEVELSNYEKQTGNEIAVAVVKSLNGGEIDDFTVRAFEEWKIGKKGKDNGILLLVAIDDRKVRIEVGYGLEGDLNDAKAGDIIRGVITPAFKENNYTKGIVDGVHAIQKAITPGSETGQVNYDPVERPSKGGGDILGGIIFGLFFIAPYVAAFLGRSKSIVAGGVMGGLGGGILGWVLLGLAGAVGVGIVLAVIGLLLDLILSRTYKVRREHGLPTTWWGSGGGFSSGGSSFGGFGGGSSGGGGASGDW